MEKPDDLDKRLVLVTGASGFLGRRTVELLVQRGYPVRALVRKTSKIDHLGLSGVEVSFGDVADVDSLKSAFEGIDYVVHAAADTSGTKEGARRVTIQGTQNILDLCASHQIKRLVYVSSCSVYGVADCIEGQVVDENAPLERSPGLRGTYSSAKLEAEKLVTQIMVQGNSSVVCLRPGTIYGRGGKNFSPMLGFSFGKRVFAVIDSTRFVLPLVYVDNMVEAIIAALFSEHGGGRIFNVVDPERVDKRRYVDGVIRKLYPRAFCFYVPFTLLAAMVAVQEKICVLLRRKPILTLYRLKASQKPIVYDASKIMHDLGWQPSVSFTEAIEKMIMPGKKN